VAGADVGSTGYAEVGFYANSDGFPPTQLSGYDANGYHVVSLGTASNYDTYSNGALFIARWSNGTYIDSLDGTPTSIALGANQGFHFAYGTSAAFPSAPTAAVAQYSFTHTTASTSASGATLGAGVTSGTVTVDFADPVIGGYPSASVSMSVQHGLGIYNVNAPNMPIIVTPASDGGLNPVFQGAGTAQNFYSSACYSACGVDVAGFLSGSKPSSIGPIPSDAGLTYTIQDTDPIHGAAGFHISTVP
jgi:hypothetical protein